MEAQAIFADTWNELTVKMIGYYHDHCWHKYTGHVDNVPEKYKHLIVGNQKFIFIFEESKINQ